jgi:hypothetical protein
MSHSGTLTSLSSDAGYLTGVRLSSNHFIPYVRYHTDVNFSNI